MAQSLSLEQICRHVLTLFQCKIERFVVIEISPIQVRVRRLVHSNEEAIRDSKLRRKRRASFLPTNPSPRCTLTRKETGKGSWQRASKNHPSFDESSRIDASILSLDFEFSSDI